MKDRYNELIKGLSDRELLFHLYLTQIILLVVSGGLSLLLFDSFQDFLDLYNWKDINIFLIGGTAGIVVVIVDVVLMKWLPPSFYDDGGLNERIFSGRSIFHIAIIAAIVAFCEELLFRGVIQTHFGLVISSIIFAVVHYRYLFNLFLFFNVVVLSFLIGAVFLITENLVVTILMHFIIDFLLGIIIKYRKKR